MKLIAADQNKSELTLRVTEAAVGWLTGIGCKPVETEVWIGDGWVADVAAAWVPTRTEAQAAKLVPRKPPWSRRELKDAWEKLYAAIPPLLSVVLEVKTTAGDFRRDKKWARQSPADLRIVSMPVGLVPESEWPAGWWVLLHGPDGAFVKLARRAPLTAIDDKSRLWVIHGIGMRIHNRTAYQRWREIQRSHRNSENEYANRARINEVVRAVLAVARAERPCAEECLTWHMRRSKLPAGITKDIEQLYGIARQTTGKADQ